MSRPRRGVEPQKYVVQDSDDEEDEEEDLEGGNESNADSEELSAFEESDDNSSEADEELPLFVSVPTDSQVSQTRAFIIQQSAKVALLQAKHLEQQKISEALEQKLKMAQKLLFETQASIATVSRVPPEVLSIIFTFHVQENHESPWLLMQVCRAWRGAALMTRSIWGRIILAPSNWNKMKKGSPRVRVWDGMEVCYKPVQLIRALKRAGAAPLDLKIVFTPSNGRRRWQMGMTTSEYDLVHLINTIPMHQSNPRLRSLIISTDSKLTLSPGTFGTFKFTELVSISLDGLYPDVIDQVIKEARGLRSVKAEASSLQKMEGCKWWAKVEEIEVTKLYNITKTEVIRSILCAATSLTSLSLEDGSISDINSPQIDLPLLKRLELKSVAEFWPINAPNLTYLVLHGALRSIELQAASIHLPHLVELSVTISLRYFGHDILSAFDMPSLRVLEFQCASGKSGTASLLKRIFDPPTASAPSIDPEIIWFRRTLVNPKVLAHVLTGCARLRELHTVGMQITSEFFDALTPVKPTKKSQTSKGGGWQIPIHALNTLVVDHLGCKVKQEQVVMEASANALIAARIKAGAPLKRFAIRFNNDEGWREFVEMNT